ncbi:MULTISPECIES: phosphatase PAP2 family protein [unclassified Mesorhizobium]|uniref:phosphatase PAP2 family protein n=1 Tax=unclassified Mesorhizobium TaxID=325217 RepID=UPI00112BC0E0|nr:MULTISPECIES: phosphatase PAP2 family protein [unclassified Mesorhizobium]TPK91237.1 hypothetical protein FJ567_28870 [Mesorhizobium sp. B2-4-16]TPL59132.1 hypothetical protein FJ956_29160 [Mesorhizobium sp. B2-4-3]
MTFRGTVVELSGDLLEDASSPNRALWQHGRLAGHPRLGNVAQKLLALCLVYISVAALIWPSAYFAMGEMYLHRLFVFGPLAFLSVMIPAAMIVSPKAPVTLIVTAIRTNGVRTAIVVTTFVLMLSAFTTYKVNIPDIVPFFCDEALADLGELLHGQAPWRIAHAFDSDILSMAVAVTYAKMWFLEWFGLVFFASLFANQPVHLRYLTGMALVIVVAGTLMATLFSSVGPIFYDEFLGGDRYAGLLEVLKQRPPNEHVLSYSDYLLTVYKADQPALGSGISAMPSVHVAIATLNAFYLGRLNRWLGAAGWAFAIFILFGSVYTGWHYVLDGYVSMLVVTVIWRCTASITDGKRVTTRALSSKPVAETAS